MLFKNLVENQNTILVFIRHFNCFVCRDLVRDLAQVDGKLLARYSLQLRVIGCGKHTAIRSFSQDTQFDSDKVFVDQDRLVYRRLNLVELQKISGLKDPTN